jgi:hypothetical protein
LISITPPPPLPPPLSPVEEPDVGEIKGNGSILLRIDSKLTKFPATED